MAFLPENEYLNRLLALEEFSRTDIPLTEKARLSLLEAIRLSATEDHYPYDDTLLRGLIVAGSAIVPALQTLGGDPLRLLSELSRNPMGYDPVIQGKHVDDELEALLSIKEAEYTQPYRVLRLAQRIAKANNLPAIDSATMVRALFQQAFHFGIDTTKHEFDYLIKNSLSNQISDILRKLGDDPLEPRESLQELLQHLDIADELGNPMLEGLAGCIPDITSLMRLEYSLAYARTIEPYVEFNCDALMFVGDKVCIRRCDYFAPAVTSKEASLAGQPQLKISMLRGSGMVTGDQLQEFEELINKASIREEELQQFFERHPRFLLGDKYTHLHSKLALIPGDRESPIPDFFAENIGSKLADIIELKLPSVELIVGPERRRGFSAVLTQALNQVREYRNHFDDKSHRRRFQDAYGVEIFRPDICLIVGRSHSFATPQERISVSDEYKNLRILTYDDILQRARWFASL